MKSIWNKDKIQNLIDNFSQPYKVISIERRDNSILYAYLKCNICGYKFYRSLERIKLGTICCEKCIKNKNTIKKAKANTSIKVNKLENALVVLSTTS